LDLGTLPLQLEDADLQEVVVGRPDQFLRVDLRPPAFQFVRVRGRTEKVVERDRAPGRPAVEAELVRRYRQPLPALGQALPAVLRGELVV
jgi:hypothetical protein